MVMSVNQIFAALGVGVGVGLLVLGVSLVVWLMLRGRG